jgi:Predicted membrane protein (DUF2231)
VFDTVLGIPVHPLVVHAVVVLAPLAAVLMVLFAVWDRFRVWSGVLTPVAVTLSLVLSPVATQSGEALQRRLPGNEAIAEHAELGDTLPWALFAAAVVAWLMWWSWRRDRAASSEAGGGGGAGSDSGDAGSGTRSGVSTALAVVGVLVAVGLAVDVTLVGHSGATAVWEGVGSQPAPSTGDD